MADILVIGLGNLILGNDAVGPLIVRELSCRLADYNSNIVFIENYSCGLELLSEIEGYKILVIIDSLESENYKAGECLEFNIEELDKIKYDNFASSHGLNLPVLWKLGEKLGMQIPDECIIFGIVINSSPEFSEEFTGEIKRTFNSAVTDIEKRLMNLAGSVHPVR